jgi:hypothetical protein
MMLVQEAARKQKEEEERQKQTVGTLDVCILVCMYVCLFMFRFMIVVCTSTYLFLQWFCTATPRRCCRHIVVSVRKGKSCGAPHEGRDRETAGCKT